MVRREASHAGSWYSDEGDLLSRQLSGSLDQVPDTIDGVGRIPKPGARVIIAPHAGYAYSGPTAAWAYKSLHLSKAKRIFLLGPSHHAHLPGCALSICDSYETPLGDLPLDHQTISELRKTGKFDNMTQSVDEAEHSLEMHLPYIYKILSNFQSMNSSASAPKDPSSFPPLVPILVGATSASTERAFGALLAPYLSDPTSIFIVSSDFCHWGTRFNYTYYLPSSSSSSSSPSTSINSMSQGRSLSRNAKPPSSPPIHDSIAQLDQLAMNAIEGGKHADFLQVLRETGNTVCGRHPIGIIMAALEVLQKEADESGEGGSDASKGRFKFVRYERSNDCVKVVDSSVSYASAFAIL